MFEIFLFTHRDQVLRVDVASDAGFQQLLRVLHETLPQTDVDLWREPSDHMLSADVYVKHQYLKNVNQSLGENGFHFHPFIQDVQRYTLR